MKKISKRYENACRDVMARTFIFETEDGGMYILPETYWPDEEGIAEVGEEVREVEMAEGFLRQGILVIKEEGYVHCIAYRIE